MAKNNTPLGLTVQVTAETVNIVPFDYRKGSRFAKLAKVPLCPSIY